jgi:hypothetical protein
MVEIVEMFTFHTDDGHGWLEVSGTQLVTLGLSPRDFTRYSYRSRDGSRFYLEEDCDAELFATRWRLHYSGREFGTVERNANGSSFIRSLPRIHDLAESER